MCGFAFNVRPQLAVMMYGLTSHLCGWRARRASSLFRKKTDSMATISISATVQQVQPNHHTLRAPGEAQML